jgi:NTP pyrophosphatase (non-canonical NTP hydrolase)
MGKVDRMNQSTELLVITMEECGELIQACSKVLRIASDKNSDKKKIAQAIYKLRMEAADVQAMINIMVEKELIDRKELGSMAVDKRKKLRKYSNIF